MVLKPEKLQGSKQRYQDLHGRAQSFALWHYAWTRRFAACTQAVVILRSTSYIATQATQALNVILFHCYANVQPNVTYGVYYYITTEFDYAKRDSGLAVYGSAVLQRFEFIKVCMRMQRLCLRSQLFLYFANKIYLLCYCVVFFVVWQLLQCTWLQHSKEGWPPSTQTQT